MKKPWYYLRFILLLLGLSLSASTVANPISREQAQQNVVSFLKSKGKFVSSASLRQAPSMMTEAVENYYVFNIGNKDGYVIAAGDDCAPAILGYSDSGCINVDSMPCNMKAWLEEYDNQIRYMRDHGGSSTSSYKSPPSHPAIPPMLTTIWGQGYPYNINCPSFFGQGQCATGCIATAMAQVMYYHRANSVNYTTEEIPAYVCSSTWEINSESLQISVDAIPAGSFIDWDNMLDTYSGSPTDTQKQAVANLMKYCGAAVRMNYGMNASSAAYSNIPIALNNYFGYSNETVLKNRNEYYDAEWDNLIYNELSNNHPVLYGGANSNGGHEFVCDGYDDGGYYHINWGWNGSCDGYFLLSALNPGSSSNGYNKLQNAVLHAVPKSAHFISFIDQQVRDLCLQNWDANSDGELSEKEASEVIDLGDVFKGSSITSFDELEWFTGLSRINEYAFEGCDLLVSITIPSNVTTIGDYAFSNTGLRSIMLPSNLTSIGNGAFEGCESMELITIPNSVTTIGGYAFSNTGLRSIMLPSNLTSIGNGAFEGCESMELITIPNSVTTIGDYAFSNTGLRSIILPSNVISVGKEAFRECLGLTSLTIGRNVSSIGSKAFDRCDALMTITCFGNEPPTLENSGCFSNNCYTRATLRVPPEAYSAYRVTDYWKLFRNTIQIPNIIFDDNNVKAICVQNWDTNRDGELSEKEAAEVTSLGEIFRDNSIYSFGELRHFIGLTCIENHSFSSCRNLALITIPPRVTLIGENAFRDCSSLTNLNIPSNVSSIDRNAFLRCSGLCSITVDPNNLTYDSRNNCNAIIEKSTNVLILGCKNTIIPTTANKIGDNAFEGCTELESISIPSSVNSLGRSAFSGCTSLSSVSIPSSVTIIGDYAFWDCVCLKNLDIPIGVNSIGSYAFYNCQSITSVTIPSSVITINSDAFRECIALTNVTIGRNVSKIGGNTFDGCDSITTVTCLGNVPRIMEYPWGGVEDCFSDRCYSQATLKVPFDYVSDYLADEHWNKFANIEGFEYNSRGDADGDGKVTINDVTTLIDYLLSGNAKAIDLLGADADSDGRVSINDVTTLIDFMLSGVWPYTPDIPDEPETETFTVNGVTFKMVAVEGGTFMMGATAEQGSDADDNEKPAHEVTLSSYSIGETEVTQALWLAVMGSNPSAFQGNLQRPVERVSWNDCQTFINKLNELTGKNFRLPTEAEWEYAARGGNRSMGYKYAGSNNINAVAWYWDNIPSQSSGTVGYGTQTVATKAPNELGLFDMSGNVMEWCQDWYGRYGSGDQTDPTGPASGANRVIRGGSWRHNAGPCRVSRRSSGYPSYADYPLGLRLVLGQDISPEPEEHEYVDLGLPSGTLWATCNVGANAPEDYGDYFAWGETEPKNVYSWETYKWCNGSSTSITKYCTSSEYGSVDNKTELDPEDDAAWMNWGPMWRTPSLEQQEELYDYCTLEWTQINGVNGRLFTGPNGNTLFLPAAGYRWDLHYNVDSNGDYWSRTLSSFNPRALGMGFSWGTWGWGYGYGRENGYTIRAVCATQN